MGQLYKAHSEGGARNANVLLNALSIDTQQQLAHKVVKGDEVRNVAEKYGMSQKQLLKLNPQLDGRANYIEPGEFINLDPAMTELYAQIPITAEQRAKSGKIYDDWREKQMALKQQESVTQVPFLSSVFGFQSMQPMGMLTMQTANNNYIDSMVIGDFDILGAQISNMGTEIQGWHNPLANVSLGLPNWSQGISERFGQINSAFQTWQQGVNDQLLGSGEAFDNWRYEFGDQLNSRMNTIGSNIRVFSVNQRDNLMQSMSTSLSNIRIGLSSLRSAPPTELELLEQQYPDRLGGYITPSTNITSYYGETDRPYGSSTHYGIDYGATNQGVIGDPVYSRFDGAISYSGWQSDSDHGLGFGQYVRIDYDLSNITGYFGHLSDIAEGITNGAVITNHQYLGNMGSTGTSTAAHLHYDERTNGIRISPYWYTNN